MPGLRGQVSEFKNMQMTIYLLFVLLLGATHGEELGACPWSDGHSGRVGELQCLDATFCTVTSDVGASEGWGCCGTHGGRARCPLQYPHMCNRPMSCANGTEYCCVENAEDCNESQAGLRVCPVQVVVDPEQIPVDANEGDEPSRHLIHIQNNGSKPVTVDLTLRQLLSSATSNRRNGNYRRLSSSSANGAEIENGHVIFALKDKTLAANDVILGMQSIGILNVQSFSAVGLQVAELSSSADALSVIKELEENPNVAFAEPDYKVFADDFAAPNDPMYDRLWGMNNANDHDIDAPEAWAIHKGLGRSVIVGVIDTGVDYNHPDLLDQMWTNEQEIPGNGIDDDGNGYVDDVHGANFITGSGDPMDDNGHGTHCAGTIGAAGNNGVGVVGVTWGPRIMGLKFLSAGGSGSTSGAIAAINYAVSMGAHLTSNSWGGGGASQAMETAIEAAYEAGQLFIAAAGNSNSNNDVRPHYPSNYVVPNIISVAATTSTDARASFSCYGRNTVHIGAPGHNILSTVPGGGYRSFSGTSMATPHVAGLAALIMDYTFSLTHMQVKEIILTSGDEIPALVNKTITGARINAHRALQMATMYRVFTIEGERTRTIAPGAVENVSIQVGGTTIPGGEYRAIMQVVNKYWTTNGTTVSLNVRGNTTSSTSTTSTTTVAPSTTSTSSTSTTTTTTTTERELDISFNPSDIRIESFVGDEPSRRLVQLRNNDTMPREVKLSFRQQRSNPENFNRPYTGKYTSLEDTKINEGRIIFAMKDKNADATSALNVGMQSIGILNVRSFSAVGLQIAELSSSADPYVVIKELQANPTVDFAEPDYIVDANDFEAPNDPMYGNLWGMNNADDHDIDAPEAWAIHRGLHRSVIVGVIDTGVDYNHPDLAEQMWTNEGEIAGNGIDDDGNGYVDDIHGANFITGSGDPMDDNGHGTHCAGTIGAAGNNSVGVVGVTWGSKIMGLKFLSRSGQGTISGAIEALNYAVMMGAHLTSNSWGGGGASEGMERAIQAAHQADQLFIAAAGNSNSNNDEVPQYPANYAVPNVISVAATTSIDGRASFSCYGRNTVHIGAPGQDILSTIPGGGYRAFSGTSMATPHVAGLAALIKDYAFGLTHIAMKDIILTSGDQIAALQDKTITGARINAHRALQMAAQHMLFRIEGSSDRILSPGVNEDVWIQVGNIYAAQGDYEATLEVTSGQRSVEGTSVSLSLRQSTTSPSSTSTTSLPSTGTTTAQSTTSTSTTTSSTECPWARHSGEDLHLECMDGTFCLVHAEIGGHDGWGCCAAHGGRARCPAVFPHMCARPNSCAEGTAHCCATLPTDCDESEWGLRTCDNDSSESSHKPGQNRRLRGSSSPSVFV